MAKNKKKKVTTSVETIKSSHRKATLGLNLTTRVAKTEDKKKDPKKSRRRWKQKREY